MQVSERGPKDRKRRCERVNQLSPDWSASPYRMPRSSRLIRPSEGSYPGPKRGVPKGGPKGGQIVLSARTAWDREIPEKPLFAHFCAFWGNPRDPRKYDPVKTVHQHLSRLGELLNTLENVHPPRETSPPAISRFSDTTRGDLKTNVLAPIAIGGSESRSGILAR